MTALLALQDVCVLTANGAELLAVDALEVARGQTLAILGSTGAGKSTLLRVMNGLLQPARGRLLWDGAEVASPMPLSVRRCMAMAFQDPLLFRGSVEDNVAYGLRVRGERGEVVTRRVRQALDRFGVARLAQRSTARLSGGEAHRVSLARALVLRPDLLLLDEPLASVDPLTRDRLGEELRRVLRDENITCVYVTHDQPEAQRMAHRIAIIDAGRILQEGTPDEVFYRPASERVARFVQTGNLLPGTVRGLQNDLAEIHVGGETIEAICDSPQGAEVVVCLRPEDVVLARPDTEQRTSARNRLRCTIKAMQSQGPVVYVTLECAFRLVAVITRRSAEDLGLREQDVVEATFKATALHVLPRSAAPQDASSP